MDFYKKTANFFNPSIDFSYLIEDSRNKEIINSYKKNIFLQVANYYIKNSIPAINISDFLITDDILRYDNINNYYYLDLIIESNNNNFSKTILLDNKLEEYIYTNNFSFKNYLENKLNSYMNIIKNEIDSHTNELKKIYDDYIKEMTNYMNTYINKDIKVINDKNFSFLEEKTNVSLSFYYFLDNLYLSIKNNDKEKKYILDYNFFNEYLSYTDFTAYKHYIETSIKKRIENAINEYIRVEFEDELREKLFMKLKENNLDNFSINIKRNNINEMNFYMKDDTVKTILIEINLDVDIDTVINIVKKVRKYPKEDFLDMKKTYDLKQNKISFYAIENEIETFIKIRNNLVEKIDLLSDNSSFDDLMFIVHHGHQDFYSKKVYQSRNYTFLHEENNYTMFCIKEKNKKDIFICFKNKEKILFKNLKKIKRKYKNSSKVYNTVN